MNRKLILIAALAVGGAILAGLVSYAVRAFLPIPKSLERNEIISAALDQHCLRSAAHDPTTVPA